MVLSGFEPLTLRLSGVYSNQLSYKTKLLEWKDSNLRFSVPKTDALTLLDILGGVLAMGWAIRIMMNNIATAVSKIQKQYPYKIKIEEQ